MTKVIRVGSSNNFNFTALELAALDNYSGEGLLFVNSNSFVKIKAGYPSIITINPYLTFVPLHGNLRDVRAVRIKWVCGAQPRTQDEQLACLNWAREHNKPILITFMRFKRNETRNRYVTLAGASCYKFSQSFHRATPAARDEALSLIKDFGCAPLMYVCDEDGRGCPSCMNCQKLCYPREKSAQICSLNLRASGDCGYCVFDCPDCYAKAVACRSGGRIKLDVVYQNRKQKGELHHS